MPSGPQARLLVILINALRISAPDTRECRPSGDGSPAIRKISNAVDSIRGLFREVLCHSSVDQIRIFQYTAGAACWFSTQ